MNWTFIIAIIFYVAIGMQLLYWGGLFMRLVVFELRPKIQKTHYEGPVSVIICTRNEAQNLERHLPAILEQAYSEFEVIVVDDQSSDESQQILQSLAKLHPHLRILNIGPEEESPPGKKYALSKGISMARFPIILLTDADCEVDSPHWIDGMVQGFNPSKSIVLGYGPYTKAPGWVNRFTRFETVYAAIQYFSLSLWGMPYMAVGRNLAYRKELYDQIGGFKSHDTVISGDDDLFIRDAANPFNTSIVTKHTAFTYSASQENWQNYFRQKKRHISTSNYYKKGVKIVLGGLSVSHLLAFGSFIFLLVGHLSVSLAVELFLIRCLTTYTVYGVCLTKWKQLELLIWVPTLEILLVIYFLILTPSLFIQQAIPWK